MHDTKMSQLEMDPTEKNTPAGIFPVYCICCIRIQKSYGSNKDGNN